MFGLHKTDDSVGKNFIQFEFEFIAKIPLALAMDIQRIVEK